LTISVGLGLGRRVGVADWDDRGIYDKISKSSDLLLGHIDADVLGCYVGVAGKGCDATGGEDAIKITTCCFGHLLVVFRPSVSVVVGEIALVRNSEVVLNSLHAL
jgi:hypothetical protein